MRAVTVSGSTPMRASLATVSRMPKPQSMSTRVAPASTSRPLPSLPLPRQAKRTLLELVLEQREDLLAVGRTVRDARGILHRHQAAGTGLRYHYPILFRLRGRIGGLPELNLRDRLRQPAVVFFPGSQVWIRVAEKIQSFGTVTIDDGKAGAIEREPDSTPRAVERIVDDQLRHAVAALFDSRAIGGVVHRRHRLGGFRRSRAESEHETLQKLGLELGIRGHHRPLPVFTRALRKFGRQLRRAAMADENLDRARFRTTLDAAAKLVALVGIVAEAQVLAGESLKKILRQVGAILGPIGFHDAKTGLLDRYHETVLGPEFAQCRPRRFLRCLHDQPALAARARNACVRTHGQKLGRTAGCTRGRDARCGADLIAVVVGRRGEIRRHFERGDASGRLVVDFLAQRQGHGLAAGKHRCGNDGRHRRARHATQQLCTQHSIPPQNSHRQPASRSAVRTMSWYGAASGVSGSRSGPPIRPISASAHLTGIGLASTNSLVCKGMSFAFAERASSSLPFSAASHIAAIARGATLAVTEMTPWPPSSIYASAVSSLPESNANDFVLGRRRIRSTWRTRSDVASLMPTTPGSSARRSTVSVARSAMVRPGTL